MMVKDPVVAPGAVGANAMAAAMVKVVSLGFAAGGEEPGDEQRNDQKSKHRILLLVRFGAKDDGKRPPHAFNLLSLSRPQIVHYCTLPVKSPSRVGCSGVV